MKTHVDIINNPNSDFRDGFQITKLWPALTPSSYPSLFPHEMKRPALGFALNR